MRFLPQIAASLLLTASFSLHATESIKNTLGMPFVQIPAGSFTMGTTDKVEAAFEIPNGNASLIDDEYAHHVTISEDYYLGQTEVTQGQWYKLMGTKPGPKANWQRDNWQNIAVVSISWFKAQEFIKALNAHDKKHHYRLPTEAEWEYAARAGSDQLRPFPLEELSDYAWYLRSSGDDIHPVAQLKPNAWGLYDIFGNAWEWTADWYSPTYYKHSPKLNPQGPKTGKQRVRRGGSYHCETHLVRPGYRAADTPDKRYSVLGFRVVMEKK